MPSGAKKRKAAKKKKEQETNFDSSSNNSQGNEDSKSQDEKESDSGENGSPSSGDHHNPQSAFDLEKNEFDESDPSSMTEGKNSTEVVPGIVGASREMGSEYYGDPKDYCTSVSKTNLYDDKPVCSSPGNAIQDTEEAPVRETGEPVVEIGIASGVYSVTPEVSVSEETISVVENEATVNPDVPDVMASGSKDEAIGKSAAFEDLASREREDVNVYSSVVEFASVKYEERLSLSSGTPANETGKETGDGKDSDIPESSENQPLVASGPQMAQRSSWFNCCGLFDAFAGSNR